MNEEIELKLILPRKALPALRRHPILAATQTEMPATTLENTYFDTPALDLLAERIGVRTRRCAHTCVQTVKAAAPSTGGLSRRPEWEQPFDQDFDFSAIDNTRVRKLLQRHHDTLAPLFSTRFRRETRRYTSDEQTRVLIMIDTGHIVAGERREAICEVELELVCGQATDLLQLAVALARDLPLMPNDASKAERGYALWLGRPMRARRSAPPMLPEQTAPLQAFRQLAFDCIGQWQHNTVGAMQHEDPEFIHQLRVALRRLRTLLRLFAPILPGDFVARWKGELRYQAGLFATVRNLDVLGEELLAPVLAASEADRQTLSRLRDAVEHARRKSRQKARQALLTRPGPGAALLALMLALHALDDEAPADQPAGLPSFARRRLDRLHQKVEKRLAGADPDEPAGLHALRIAIKQLRYGLDQLSPSLSLKPKALRHYDKKLSALQTRLGYLNDVAMLSADPDIEHLAARSAVLRQATAYVRGWHNACALERGRAILQDVVGLIHKPSAPWTPSRRTRDGR